MTSAAPAAESFWVSLYRRAGEFVYFWGDAAEFTWRLLRWLVARRPCRGTILPNFYQIGVRSVPVIATTGLFIGMVLAVQSYAEFTVFRE
jgi:ABC-type transporter Mla maintaining outer membrane lipid asymmetry permease subunit MlaE